jgi:hypothetical protein
MTSSNHHDTANIGGVKKDTNMNKKGKYIVFDVDETLGYFSQLGSFIDALSFYNKDFSGSVFERFNKILDLFPEFVRPKMIEILKYIHEKKVTGSCSGLFIYTNNQGPRSWVQHIAKYFDYKVGGIERKHNETNQLFDKIIAAYMVNGKVVEPGRTSQNKTYADLLRITGISPQAEVCFVDDLNHPEMRHENVLYLNVKPYVKTLSVNEMIRRYLKSPLAATIVSVKEFTMTISERMGSVKHINRGHNRRLNLHDSNYISLNNTPFDSVASREDAEYKASGETLFHYIQYFFKTNNPKMQSRRAMRRGDSQTRRRRGPRRHSKDENDASVSISTHQTRKHGTKGNKRLHMKTRRNGIGKFMRI